MPVLFADPDTSVLDLDDKPSCLAVFVAVEVPANLDKPLLRELDGV